MAQYIMIWRKDNRFTNACGPFEAANNLEAKKIADQHNAVVKKPYNLFYLTPKGNSVLISCRRYYNIYGLE